MYNIITYGVRNVVGLTANLPAGVDHINLRWDLHRILRSNGMP